MNSLSRTPWYAAVGIIIVLAGAFLLNAVASPYINQKYAEYNETVAPQLQGFFMPELTVGIASYTIDEHGGTRRIDGVVPGPREAAHALGLAHYALMHRLDPIFALEGTDPQQLTDAVVALREGVRSFAIPYPPAEADRLVETLYPTNFLLKLSKLERARQRLLEHPSDTTASAYHEQLIDAFNAYTVALEQYLDTLNAVTTENDDRVLYCTLDGCSTFPHLRRSIAQMKESAAVQRAREMTRWQCYGGDAAACPSIHDAFQKLTNIPSGGVFEPTHTRPMLPGKERADEVTRTNPKSGEVAPYVIERHNACIPGAESLVQIPVWLSDAEGAAFTMFYGDDLYLMDFSDTKPKALYAAAIEAGVTRKFQGIFNFYMCRQALLSVAGVRNDLAIRSAASADLPGTLTRTSPQLGALHETVTGETSLQTEQVAAYVHELGEVLRRDGERSFVARFGAPALLSTERILNMARERSAATDELIRKVTLENGYLNKRNNIGSDPFPLRELFNSRSDPFFFFFTHNKSFLAQAPAPTLDEEYPLPPLDDVGWLVSYQRSLQDRYTPEEIVAEARRGMNVYQEVTAHLNEHTNFMSLPFLATHHKKHLPGPLGQMLAP